MHEHVGLPCCYHWPALCSVLRTPSRQKILSLEEMLNKQKSDEQPTRVGFDHLSLSQGRPVVPGIDAPARAASWESPPGLVGLSHLHLLSAAVCCCFLRILPLRRCACTRLKLSAQGLPLQHKLAQPGHSAGYPRRPRVAISGGDSFSAVWLCRWCL